MTENKNLNENEAPKTQTHYLWWVNEKTGKRHSAGVAFYSEEYGEYRLKLDCFPQNQYYLKSVGSEDNRVNYRAEVVFKRKGKFVGRRPIGIGYQDKETAGEVHIELGPFSNTLILDA